MIREQALETLSTANPRLRGKMRKEIAQLVLDGQVDADEAARFLLAREIKKLPEPVATFG